MNTFLTTFTQRLTRSQYIKGIEKEFISKETNPYYNHLTFKIKNLVEYIQVITAIANVHHERFLTTKKVYRGIADSDWKLIPSLARSKAKNSLCAEYDMISEMISEKPDEFKSLSHNFEVIAKMQHYGLPTRLLDFSFSPLIALYFACCDKPSKPGRVVVGETNIYHYNEPVVEAICGLYKHPYCHNMLLDDWLKEYNIEPNSYMRMLYLYENDTLLTFVKPLYINERMRIQQSVFAIFTNEIIDLGSYSTYYGDNDFPCYNDEIQKYEPINEIYTNYIYSGDNRPQFYVDPQIVDTILCCYKNKDNYTYNAELITKMFINRFGLSEYMRMIEPYDVSSNYCSIIIDKNKKRCIIDELSKLGIDKSFVYPELEYTAEKVKKNVIG